MLLSHCILNQNTVVDGLERASGAFKLTDIIVASGAGILQLPCPEFFMMNLDRPGMTFEEYDKPEFREIAEKILKPLLWQVHQYQHFGFKIAGIIGIQGSPNSGISCQTGVFMKILLNELKLRNITPPLLEVPPNYGTDPEVDENFHQEMRLFLESKSES